MLLPAGTNRCFQGREDSLDATGEQSGHLAAASRSAELDMEEHEGSCWRFTGKKNVSLLKDHFLKFR